MLDTAFLRLNDLTYFYTLKGKRLPVLQNISFAMYSGERIAILGASGSGKTTLLNILGLLDTPSSGTYFLDGQAMNALSAAERSVLRNRYLGFVFQSFYLVPHLSAQDNVALPLMYRGLSRTKAREFAQARIERVGLSSHLTHRPSELSGGQCQRIAIARALVGAPQILFADEPTGNLDSDTAKDILSLLNELNQEEGLSLIIVTHDESIARSFPRLLRIEGGALEDSGAINHAQ